MADIPFFLHRTQALVATLQPITFSFVHFSCILFLQVFIWTRNCGDLSMPYRVSNLILKRRHSSFILRWSEYLLLKRSTRSAHSIFFCIS